MKRIKYPKRFQEWARRKYPWARGMHAWMKDGSALAGYWIREQKIKKGGRYD